MVLDNYEDYDCGSPCTPNGCPGHEGRPVGLVIDGRLLADDDHVRGDDLHEPERLEAVLRQAADILSKP